MVLCVYLQGGLGNQLFQLAAAMSLGNSLANKKVQVSPDLLAKVHGQHKRSFSIEPLLEPSEILRGSTPPTSLTKLFHFMKILEFENQIENDVKSYVRPQTRHLIGYFQNALTVESVWELLRERISKTPQYEMLLQQPKSEYVAVHVRLGDYVQLSKAQEIHGTCSIDYYVQALKIVTEATDCRCVKLVSDDIETAKTVFDKTQLDKKYDFEFIENQTELADLSVLAQASGVVMSNSTFSWWGAFIADKQRNSPIVYPTPWFAAPEYNARDLFPKHWKTSSRLEM